MSSLDKKDILSKTYAKLWFTVGGSVDYIKKPTELRDMCKKFSKYFFERVLKLVKSMP